MADYCVDEVRYYVQSYISSRFVPAIDGGIIKSDCNIDSHTRHELLRAMDELNYDHSCQEIPAENKTVVDVVDPYLFLFAWNRTRTLRKGSIKLKDCIGKSCEGSLVRSPPSDQCEETAFNNYRNDMAWSNHFQWLPFDLKFDKNGTSRVSSLINNVHLTRFSRLYAVTERLMDSFIPLFNATLLDTKAPGYKNSRIHLVDFRAESLIDRDPREAFRPQNNELTRSFSTKMGTTAKMVMHAQDINLAPKHPDFEGEEWHVQGQNNERICATVTCIYSASNMLTTTQPAISFRCRIFPEEAIVAKGEIKTPPFLSEIYGAKNGDPILQCLGEVDLREGRAVMWPNTFQTRLNQFSLDDHSKPGHPRMLTLHLIDPNRRIMSTAMVPCQRRDWWAEAIPSTCPALRRLPIEVFDRIVASVDDYPILLTRAGGHEMSSRLREEYRKRHTQTMEGYEE